MEDLTIRASEFEKAILLSQAINSELNRSNQMVEELKRYLSTAAWSGNTKDAFVVYLELIHQYHQEMVEIMMEHEKVLNELQQSINAYNASSEVRSIEGF